MGVPAAGAARELSPPDLNGISSALRELHRLTPSSDIDQIRERQRTHFKVNQRFPAYIDIGLSVWERLNTWHLENHLPLATRRTPEGRMEMDYMYTTLILKWDMADAVIGVPYD
jgi:hypothetical protein